MIRLVEELGGEVAGVLVLIELEGLKGTGTDFGIPPGCGDLLSGKIADNEGYDMGMTEEKTTQSNTTQLVLDDGRIEEIREFTSPEQLYQDLIDRVRKYHPSDDISLIEKAYNLAREAHQGQVRKFRRAVYYPSSLRGPLFWRIWSWTRRRSWRGCFTTWWRIPS